MHLSQKFAHPKYKSRVKESLNFDQLIEAVDQASHDDQSWVREKLPKVKRKRGPKKKPIVIPQKAEWPSVELPSEKAVHPPEYQFYYPSDASQPRQRQFIQRNPVPTNNRSHTVHVPIDTGAWANGKIQH